MQKGILVTSSAGNTGPLPGTVNNRDPWLLTIGASTTDRKLRVTVRLGDGKEIYGGIRIPAQRLLRDNVTTD
ncbi:hypothetical protein KY285_029944 [Solanum tuberosum]|nr:hypothetical protein KY285_029944 [Solanum tuberosum]